MKKIAGLLLVTLSMLLLGLETAFANDRTNPVEMLESVANQMMDTLKANQSSLKSDPAKTYAIAYKIVVPHADIAEMSKRVLPPQTWQSASAAQRSKFEAQFTKLLVGTYASALADYTNQTVKFYPVRGGYEGKSTVSVSSQIIRSDGPPVVVNYRLIHASTGGWKLFDMTVEGISLLESFRSQFADKLAKGNMDALINDLSNHNANQSGS